MYIIIILHRLYVVAFSRRHSDRWPALLQFLFVVLRQDLARLRLALNPAKHEDGKGALPHSASLWLSGDFCCKHFGLCFFRFISFVMENSCTSELCSVFRDDCSGIHHIQCVCGGMSGSQLQYRWAVPPVGSATCAQLRALVGAWECVR